MFSISLNQEKISKLVYYINNNKKVLFYIVLFILIISISMFLMAVSYNFSCIDSDSKFDGKDNIQSKVITHSINNSNKFENNEIVGYLTIPKINLNNVVIMDGTNDTILENFIGHFKESSYIEGNVCLAAHSFGTKYNYFCNLYKLKVNDEIYYFNRLNLDKYLVSNIREISELDIEVLNNSNQDILTLITCVKSNSTKRLCVIAKKI